MNRNAVLLDTSFFLRLLNEHDPLFKNSEGYFRYFLENDYILFISTISIAEYCVIGTIDQLPLRNLRVLPFNVDHAKRTGEFARILFSARRSGNVSFNERRIIPNDSKLFAQADVEAHIRYFAISDAECMKAHAALTRNTHARFDIIDINQSYGDRFGILPL
jgi:predicted nucleic acid-binding protein